MMVVVKGTFGSGYFGRRCLGPRHGHRGEDANHDKSGLILGTNTGIIGDETHESINMHILIIYSVYI